MKHCFLKPSDRVEITILVDNYIDIFEQSISPVDHRLPLDFGRHLLAEHGFSCLVKVFLDREEHVFLFDTGLSRECLNWNAQQIGISLKEIEGIVLSHGHFDHIGGLEKTICDIGHPVPLIVHPDAFFHRRMNSPNGLLELPGIDTFALRNIKADIRMSSEPSILAAGGLLVTGEVERNISFETGMPGMEMFEKGSWVTDPIRDDQALVMNIKHKGLVIISGCAHAGIINTIDYAKKITGNNHIHAILGGFHLTGPAFASRIQPTIDALKSINPDYVVPMHCTGWNAINQLFSAIPGKIILNTVGTRYCFDAF